MRDGTLEEHEWAELSKIVGILQYFNRATQEMTAQKIPTLFAAVPVYNYLIDKLEEKQEEALSTEENAAVSATLEKLKYYYCRANSVVYAICTSKPFFFLSRIFFSKFYLFRFSFNILYSFSLILFRNY